MTPEEALQQLAEKFSWNASIQYDIRRMRSAYYERHGKKPNRILLDTQAESRLTAWVICHSLSQGESKQVDEILEVGIRQMGIKMYGMEIFFDYPEFCVARVD